MTLFGQNDIFHALDEESSPEEAADLLFQGLTELQLALLYNPSREVYRVFSEYGGH